MKDCPIGFMHGVTMKEKKKEKFQEGRYQWNKKLPWNPPIP